MFYGWRVVAGAFTAQLFFVGYFNYAISLLTPALQREFGVSLEQVMYGMTIATFAGLVVSPLAGALVDRLPVRLLMAVGSAIFGAGLLLMARSTSIGQYVWVFGLTMALGNGLANSIPAMAVVSRWFGANRGRALGIAAIGTSLGGVVVPALVRWWLDLAGWRAALDYMAACVLLIMLPAVVLLVRGRPEDVGLSAEPETHADAGFALPGPGARELLANPAFWTMSLSLGLTMAGYTAVLTNLAPYAVSAGEGEDVGTALIIAVAVCGLVGKLVFGAVADRFDLRHGLWTAQGLAVAAFALFAALPPYAGMLFAACLMGLAAGGLMPVWGAMLAKVFGLRSYGLAMGLMTPVITLCILPTFVIVGRLVDTTGSFRSPLLLFAATTAVAAVALLPLRIPGYGQPGAGQPEPGARAGSE